MTMLRRVSVLFRSLNVLLFYFCIILKLCGSTASGERCIAQTNYGQVRGHLMTSYKGREFCAFLGIPFAAPPTGVLRFMPPTSPKPWEGVKDCIKEGNKCWQQREDGCSEDCLYLNIFTHSIQPNCSYPVMVFIHGGGFYIGSSSLNWTGPEYLMDEDILLVSIQYRLGVFGFLSTEDNVIPGNMGLKDQVKALQWVQENIESFGGDKHKVTIFGNSAGSASVHYHMMSPVSKSLFIRGISQSGTALASFALMGKGKPKKDTENLAKNLLCSTTSSTEILHCLQKVSANDILQAFKKMQPSPYVYPNKMFLPVIEVETDHAFITKYPETFKTDKPWLVGLNSREGLWRIDQQINQTINLIKTNYKNSIPFLIQYSDLYSNAAEITDLTNDFYFGNLSSTEEYQKSFEHLTTDTWFAWPTERAITFHCGSLYYYVYNHQAQNQYAHMYGLELPYRGSVHTDELLMLFTQIGNFPFLTGNDLNVSKLMVKMWTNFAAEGNPTPKPVRSNPQDKSSAKMNWKASENHNPTYLNISTYQISMETHLFKERMDFWRGVNFINVK